MIISASYRSDIPAFHGDWFRAALRVGQVTIANPYNRKPALIDLRPDSVDGYVFWTRNARPFAPALNDVADQGKPFVVHYTILGYPPEIDARVIDARLAVEDARRIAERYGKRAVVWRYDPILLSPLTEIAWHRANFARLADALGGVSDEVVVSFAQIYAKSARNLSKAGIVWRAPDLSEQIALLRELSEIAAARGFRLTLCSQPDLAEASGMPGASCIDAARLGDVAGAKIAAPIKGNRPGCLCAASRDIGAYDSCVHGCSYCYAVADHEAALTRMQSQRRTASPLTSVI